jgi:hypothetical protein
MSKVRHHAQSWTYRYRRLHIFEPDVKIYTDCSMHIVARGAIAFYTQHATQGRCRRFQGFPFRKFWSTGYALTRRIRGGSQRFVEVVDYVADDSVKIHVITRLMWKPDVCDKICTTRVYPSERACIS